MFPLGVQLQFVLKDSEEVPGGMYSDELQLQPTQLFKVKTNWYSCVYHTQVVVLRDGCGCSGARSLLGEVVAKLHYAGVLLQHFSYFHLYSST